MSSPRLKIGLYASVLLAVFVLASYKLYRRNDGRSPQKDEVLIKAMLQGLSQAHYQPERIDDAFSKRVFDLYLKRLDSSKKFLLQSDVDQLRKYQNDIDNQVQRGTHEFMDLGTQLMAQRVKDIQGLYRDILSKPFDFTTDETFETESDKVTFAANAAAQREEWRKFLKYQTMVRVSEMMDEQAKKKDKPLASTSATPSSATTSEPTRTPAQMEAEARKRVLKYFDDYFKDLQQTDANDRLAMYANTIANTYDPHTEYFAPRDKETFDIAMTGRFEGIGASLQEKDGQIKVSDIIPGSASYRQGELKAGDIILRVAQGPAEPVSVEGMRLDKAVSMIKGKKGTEVRLTVKKPDASTKVISIIRDVVVIEETYAQSATINDNGTKLGYIKLPNFYADFNDNGGRSSAADVKKELEKLKAENVQGVVLDLRFNGGGSLQDAVEMAGLFVESGPVVQVRNSQGAPTILNDRDPRVQYGGPLVVLVNKYSASASEILAAAIQDYKRGVVMGSASTYGKGTVQRIFDLDEAMPAEFNSIKPFGSLKLTTSKFYRINGGSTQFKGVIPDIILPDAYSYLDQGEKETDYPLKWDEITPARYRAWNAAPAIDKLRQASTARVNSSASFKQLSDMVARMVKRKDDTKVSLKLTNYRAEQEQAKAESDKYEAIQNAAQPIAIAPLTFDLRQLGADTIKVNRASRFVKPLKKDITLREAVAVLKDQI
ncbi:carboxyl-terminal processing protease [Hymenobacter luteus]|uniref:Carboxyl-terminal processing protease n=2 Tax=Hymenobacter TaxID=89966 RepID=A0A7W9T025_9BACT|nr:MULTISPECIES: carboxy terminal-processing peptidase [Hymenobacter]MBB4600691.1 carboxyl-terminal processing protease [Hymenobacter latericoloratus]MBB6059102.1 carboxyl-terminal processing protease [Hymenobacter luteus]